VDFHVTHLSILQELRGLTVTGNTAIHGYIQLGFGKEVGVSIYNDWSITPESMALEQLIGKTIGSIIEESTSITIAFLDGPKPIIDMTRQGYNGPEALQFNRKGKPIVIVN
jgi:hypothetical protein